MLDSVEGLRTPTTRQKAGRFLMDWPLGRVNDPAGTACAVAIVVPGSVRVARLSQVAAMAVAKVIANEAS